MDYGEKLRKLRLQLEAEKDSARFSEILEEILHLIQAQRSGMHDKPALETFLRNPINLSFQTNDPPDDGTEI